GGLPERHSANQVDIRGWRAGDAAGDRGSVQKIGSGFWASGFGPSAPASQLRSQSRPVTDGPYLPVENNPPKPLSQKPLPWPKAEGPILEAVCVLPRNSLP